MKVNIVKRSKVNKTGEGPSIYVRLFCFIVKLSLIFFLAYTLVPLLLKDGLISFSFIDIGKVIFNSLNLGTIFKSWHTLFVQSLISFYVCYHLVELFFSILLGRDFASFLLSVDTKDSFWRKRSKAFWRAVLGFFAAPLVFLDIPYRQKQTLKEKITGTYLLYENHQRIKYVFPLLTVVAVVLFFSPISLCCFTPHSIFVSKKNLSVKDTGVSLVDRGRNVSSSLSHHKMTIYSKRLALYGVLDIPDTIIILPTTQAGVVILDTRREPFVGELYLSKNFGISQLFDSRILDLPFLEAKYPNLNNYLVNKSEDSIDQNQFGHETFHFISNALEYNNRQFAPSIYPRFLIDHGPFTASYLKLKDRFVELLGVKPSAKVEFREYPDGHLLVIQSESRLEQFVPLRFGNYFSLYEYKVSHLGASDISRIVEKIVKGHLTSKNTVVKNNVFTAFNAVDYLSVLESGHYNTTEDNKALLDYFFMEYDKVRGLSQSSLIRFKVNESIYNYIQELKRFLRSDVDTQELQDVIWQLEKLISVPA